MRSCPECNRAMKRDTSSDVVSFKCYCGFVAPGLPEDAQIANNVLNAEGTEEMYKRLIRNAASDPVNQIVKKDCPSCGLDYMTQLRVGENEIVIWVCKCGYNSTHLKEAGETHPQTPSKTHTPTEA